MLSPSSIQLSSKTTVAQYRALENNEDRVAISAFLRVRLTERYIASLSTHSTRKNGFAIMALACLLIETLESFHRGSVRTKGAGCNAFASFFARHPEFSKLEAQSASFYANVRCGILHQGETNCGWRVRRDGPLFNETTKTVNAVKFIGAVERALGAYCDKLTQEPWDSDYWKRCRKKLESICQGAVEDAA
jgi:hypothetical protein